ncbi:glycylpeptide N-tetradecanoyltransferase [Colletotrichum orchidophilum]|uniref:Glycylpeptide N-tetradecanoyltransferase n=1 Tax=Colletotrichum orchidophilum TaxID=1209926 RepID=A0A1G4B1C8_9PEZI|nr:glycylpeptide N-tetradecanoyltransferase [Colletotrichum orchidophilum]OHE95102.1 glycylpeptide N-tetradecanoyltransferase [Colletotrichum orchidophilum]
MSAKTTSLSAEEIQRHPAYDTTQWDLKSRLSGFATVAESRPGGPFPMWYEVHGHGSKKIVWIMGLGGSRNIWKRQNRHFGHLCGEKYSSLVFDNRGVGKSAKPNCRYTTSDMAKDIVELLRHIGWLDTDSEYYPRDLNIAGISLGGMIAQELALLIPQRLQSLVLISTAPRLIRTVHTLEHIKQRFAILLPKGADIELKSKAHRLFTERYLNAPDTGSLDPEKTFPTNLDRFVAEELAERAEDTEFSRRKGVIFQAIAAGWHYKSDEDLVKIGDGVGRSRILVMHGTFDETITFPHFELIKAALGEGPEYIAWKDCGHMPLWEREEEFNEAIKDFIDKTVTLPASL